jgi:hypothetical protein
MLSPLNVSLTVNVRVGLVTENEPNPRAARLEMREREETMSGWAIRRPSLFLRQGNWNMLSFAFRRNHR